MENRKLICGALIIAIYQQLYYKQKGVRPVTRPQVLQETFEQCSEVITQKLQSYYQQADDYHNQCLQGRLPQLQWCREPILN